MKLYELNYSTVPNLAEEEQKNLQERLISSLQIQPLKQESLGFLTTIEFYSEPAKIEEMEKKIKAEPAVKRFLLVKKPTLRAHLKPKRTLGTLPKTEKKTEKPKVELQEIEKKLDEILK